MPLADISNVTISLNTSAVSRAGFGTPLFMSAGNFFFGRTATYANMTEVAAVYPTHTNVYKACNNFFSNTPDVPFVKIGRIDCQSEFTPDILDSQGSLIVGLTVAVTITDNSGNSYVASHTTQGGDTPTSVSTTLVTAINLDAVKVVATDLTGSFSLDGDTGSDEYTTTAITNLTFSVKAATGEAVATALTNIRNYDDDWYALTCESRVKADVLALASAVEALDKIYVMASDNTDAITYAQGSGSITDDVLDELYVLAYARTIGYWHHDASTNYPECAFLGYNLPYDAGSITWGNIQVPVSAAQDPATDQPLNSTQKGNLAERNANFQATTGGINYNRQGKVIGGEWIDVIRGRDNLVSDLTADIFDLLTNQQGGKIPFTDAGINQVKAVIQNRINFYVNQRNFLTDPISYTVPRSVDIPANDKANRTLNGLSFTATLAGAIHIVNITGTLEL